MKVAFIDRVHPVLAEKLKAANFECIDFTQLTRTKILPQLKSVEGLVIRSKFLINEEVFNACPQLKFIARSGSGMENIDVKTAQKLGIQCFNSPEGNRDAVSEHVIGMLLMAMNQLNKANQEVRNGIWDREGNRGEEIYTKTFALIGYGVMGKALAQRLKGFNCTILAYDAYKTGFSDDLVKEASMEEIYKEADIVSIHVNYLPQNHHFINASFFNQFHKNIYFINSARGKCVDTQALILALKEQKIKAACLDVLEQESVAFENKLNTPELKLLMNFPNVFFSPHVAGWTNESYYKLSSYLAQKILVHFTNPSTSIQHQ